MKYLLAIMCGIVVLFMGGCAVLTAQAMPLPLIPGGIAFLNVLILGALFGWKTSWRPAFFIVGGIDVLLALGALWAATSLGGGDMQFFVLAGAVIGLKGLLSLAYGWKMGGTA